MLVQESIPTPASIKHELSLSEFGRGRVHKARRSIEDVLTRNDPRLLMVIGPCSIHNTEEAIEYAERLKSLADSVADEIFIVLRAYFEKPRTTIGWKDLINDPHLDESFDIQHGLKLARQFLLDVVDVGLPTATEALDPMITHYIQDLVAWSAIGARTMESQTHREIASGLQSTIGVKNGTDGSLVTALNAITSIAAPHRFLDIDQHGRLGLVSTNGNSKVHIVLRGGRTGSNYDANTLAQCADLLNQHHLPQNVMIDCSHENSNKNHEMQSSVFQDVVGQIRDGNPASDRSNARKQPSTWRTTHA